MGDLIGKYRGCMVGLAIGDALGYPVEFISRAEMMRRLGPEGVTDFVAGSHPAGFYSDDTQMSLALARALFEDGHADLETIMSAVGREFVEWCMSEKNDRAPGGTCMRACRRLANGVHWREAGKNDSKGCGTAMRATPVGLRYHGDLARLREVAVAQSLATHGHPCATAGSVVVAMCVDLALSGVHPADWRDPVLDEARAHSDECARRLEQAWGLQGVDPAEALVRIGEGWVAEEAVAAALFCVLQSPDDYAATVLMGANTDGDSDSIACIAGAMSGARNGADAIPETWCERVEDAAVHSIMADALHSRWAAAQSSAG